jgi:hypothetical protein
VELVHVLKLEAALRPPARARGLGEHLGLDENVRKGGKENMNEQVYDIRLPDGSIVQWTAQQIADCEDEWQVNLMVIQGTKRSSSDEPDPAFG